MTFVNTHEPIETYTQFLEHIRVRASIWENAHNVYSVSLSCEYRAISGEWLETTPMTLEETLIAQSLLSQAIKYIQNNKGESNGP